MEARFAKRLALSVRVWVGRNFGSGLAREIFRNKELVELANSKSELFLLPEGLSQMFSKIGFFNHFFYAGFFIGTQKGRRFLPSLGLAQELLKLGLKKKLVRVDVKTENLFIMGRDAFSRGIISASADIRKGDLVVVVNKDFEALGFGEVVVPAVAVGELGNRVAVENVVDIGDFIRRREGRDLRKSENQKRGKRL